MQGEFEDSTFTFTDPDGDEIFCYRWGPPADVTPKAVVQVEHGAAEHALRYERLARVLNEQGYVVYADDHRGHRAGLESLGLHHRGRAPAGLSP